MPEPTHALFSPSKLPRIIRCPGSARYDSAGHNSSYADEGTYLHSLVEDYLTREVYQVPKDVSLHSDRAKHEDYASAVEACLEWIFTLKASNPNFTSEFIEAQVTLKDFADYTDCAQMSDVAGTVDYLFIVGREIYVVDWKFGKGVVVYPDSEQLRAYALGALKNVVNAGFYDKVHCVIGQPRVGDDPFRTCTYSVTELLSWLSDTLAPALRQTMSNDPIFCPSDKACRWCVRRTRCEARHEEALKVAEDVFAAHAVIKPVVSEGVSLEALKLVLDKASLLKGYIKDISNFAFQTIAAGNSFPGYKLVAGRSIRKWANEETAKEVLEEHGFDISELSEIEFYSPTKVEKVLKKQANEKFFTDLVIKPAGAATLTVETDSREALKFQTAEEVFSVYTDENDQED